MTTVNGRRRSEYIRQQKEASGPKEFMIKAETDVQEEAEEDQTSSA